MITTIKLINILSHIVTSILYVMKSPEIYSFSKFLVFDTGIINYNHYAVH